MKRILAAIAALAIALPALANAQGILGAARERQEEAKKSPPAPQQDRAGPREAGRGNAERAAPPARTPEVAQGRGGPNAPQPNATQIAPQHGRPQPNVVQERDRRGQGNAQLAPRQGGTLGNFAQNQDRQRDFRSDDRGRDFRGTDRNRNGRSFNFRGRQYAAVRGPSYSYPRGWGYHHCDRGQFLPSVFLGAPFYFDYDWLGLPPPPPGTRWVRNGPDALLVNVYNDRIEDVIYDAFY